MVSSGEAPPDDHYDVVVFGGAFSGSALALLLRRRRPGTRILILEKSEAFDRKVGESTSEVAGCFLTRVLGLSHHLAGEHYQKHGLRMWFDDGETRDPARCSEIGPFSQARLPTYQIDRSKLDQHLLEMARDEGCEVLRPATIKSFELGGSGRNRVTFKHLGQQRQVTAGWVADCSGRAALIARQRGTLEPLPEHPVHSMWVRFRGVRSLDDHATRHQAPFLDQSTWTARSAATNHLMGHGWWSWIIPLPNGDFSAGVTWDERHHAPPAEGPVGERVKQQLLAHPIGRLMFAEAEPIENDARIYKHLPYRSREVCGDGWILAGDAAGFMDPLYSQGLDYCAHGVYAAHHLIARGLDGEDLTAALRDHDHAFAESFERWFEAIYHDKYEYLGDAEIMRAAFLLDIASYFVGPVQLVYRWTDREFSKMPYDGPVGAAFARFMALYNRRFRELARKRRHAGAYGRRNLDRRFFIRTPYEASPKALRHLLRGMLCWLRLEVHGLTLPKAPRAQPSPAPTSTHAPPAATEASQASSTRRSRRPDSPVAGNDAPGSATQSAKAS